MRRELVRDPVPAAPGGGTVAFVDPAGHRYLDDPVAREEGRTPAIVESIRAGLVVALKQAVGTDVITAREEQLWRHVLRRWAGMPQIEVLGNQESRRLSIVSFRIRHGAQYPTAAPRPALTLAAVSYTADGHMTYPRHRGHAGEDVYPSYLHHARHLLAGCPPLCPAGPPASAPTSRPSAGSRCHPAASARNPRKAAAPAD